MKTPGQAIVFFVAVVSLPIVTSAQSLADVAKKTEEERAKAKQGQPARVFTNKDLVDVAGPRAAASGETTTVQVRSTSAETTTQTLRAEDRGQTREPSLPQCQEGSPTGVRMSRVPGVNGDAVETTLTLVLRGRQRGELPVNLVFRAVHDNRSQSDEPRELSLLFTLGPTFAGPLDLKPPHVVFVVDDGRASADAVAASIDGPLVGAPISTVSIEPFSLADLARLGHATTLRGRLFNIEFTLTPEQVCSIHEFSQRARQRPNRPGVVF